LLAQITDAAAFGFIHNKNGRTNPKPPTLESELEDEQEEKSLERRWRGLTLGLSVAFLPLFPLSEFRTTGVVLSCVNGTQPDRSSGPSTCADPTAV
jgi:hypothetical protein